MKINAEEIATFDSLSAIESGRIEHGKKINKETHQDIWIDSEGDICVDKRDVNISFKKGRKITVYAVQKSGHDVKNLGLVADYLYQQ